jgi:hypothetical protein
MEMYGCKFLGIIFKGSGIRVRLNVWLAITWVGKGVGVRVSARVKICICRCSGKCHATKEIIKMFVRNITNKMHMCKY